MLQSNGVVGGGAGGTPAEAPVFAHHFAQVDWGRTAAITSIALVIWRFLMWFLGIAWGRYVQKAIAPEFEQLRKEIRRDRRLRRAEYQTLSERVARLEGKQSAVDT